MSKLITSVSSFEELGEAIRNGTACIPITHLSGGDPKMPQDHFGSLVAEGTSIDIKLRSTSPDQQLTDFNFGTKRIKPTAYQLKFTLDGHLNVTIPRAYYKFSGSNSNTGSSHRYTFDTISLDTAEPDEEISDAVHLVAKIANSHLIHKNLFKRAKFDSWFEGEQEPWLEPDGLGGTIAPYSYMIRQDEGDLLFKIRLLEGQTSPTAESDRKFLSALLLVFFWINGGHPYPYITSHHRSGKLIESTIQPVNETPRCKARLINTCHHEEKAAEILRCGVEFFRSDSTFAKSLRLFLWQYREATKEGSISLGMLLQACTLLEGIIGLVLHHPMGLSDPQINKLRLPNQSSTDKRQGCAEARFRCASEYVGFDWDTEISATFNIWKKVRNALAHGNLAEWETHQASIFEGYARIIQTFNCIALRSIGYTGPTRIDGGLFAVSDY